MKPKPCPFCGSEAYSTDELPDNPKRPWQVFCRKDNCQAGIDLPESTEEAAIAKWNNRPGENSARLEGLKTARDRCADFGANHVITVEAINEIIEATK